jgi:hypothetical protein
MRPGREAIARWFVLLAASIGLLTAVSACTAAPSRTQEDPSRLPALPALSVGGHRIEPAKVVYHRDGTSRNVGLDRAATRALTVRNRDRLSMRLVSSSPVLTLRVGSFARVNSHGLPVDGGDQWDCLADSPCKVAMRAGSMRIVVPLGPAVRAVVVRATSESIDGGTLEAVWRFRPEPGA